MQNVVLIYLTWMLPMVQSVFHAVSYPWLCTHILQLLLTMNHRQTDDRVGHYTQGSHPRTLREPCQGMNQPTSPSCEILCWLSAYHNMCLSQQPWNLLVVGPLAPILLAYLRGALYRATRCRVLHTANLRPM